jgi:NAD(P)-dependent dehydrogenase (short-subunit alcohol dehydrogenase family)
VNDAAVFRDASLHAAPPTEVLDLIGANLAPAAVGCATAVGRFLAAGVGGVIVNASSHQAARPVTQQPSQRPAKAAASSPPPRSRSTVAAPRSASTPKRRH